MVFSSLFFLYIFLPLCLLLYFIQRSLTAKNIVLVCASLVFYAWGEPVYVLLMLAVSALNWGFSLAFEKKRSRALLALCVALNLSGLIVFKYAGFLVENCNAIFKTAFAVPQISLPIGIWGFIVLSYFVIVGTSNAVNLTDGLDGLAILPSALVGIALGIFAYVVGRVDYAAYLNFPYVPGAGEVVVVGAALIGAGLGFLWYNAYPAQVFMGDVGALALGGALGMMAIITRQELVLFIMGGVFVMETLSVILQVSYFKITHGKRIFLMTPIHHHFEMKGWKETQVVVRFWIITIVLVLIGLSTLKIR